MMPRGATLPISGWFFQAVSSDGCRSPSPALYGPETWVTLFGHMGNSLFDGVWAQNRGQSTFFAAPSSVRALRGLPGSPNPARRPSWPLMKFRSLSGKQGSEYLSSERQIGGGPSGLAQRNHLPGGRHRCGLNVLWLRNFKQHLARTKTKPGMVSPEPDKACFVHFSDSH